MCSSLLDGALRFPSRRRVVASLCSAPRRAHRSGSNGSEKARCSCCTRDDRTAAKTSATSEQRRALSPDEQRRRGGSTHRAGGKAAVVQRRCRTPQHRILPIAAASRVVASSLCCTRSEPITQANQRRPGAIDSLRARSACVRTVLHSRSTHPQPLQLTSPLRFPLSRTRLTHNGITR